MRNNLQNNAPAEEIYDIQEKETNNCFVEEIDEFVDETGQASKKSTEVTDLNNPSESAIKKEITTKPVSSENKRKNFILKSEFFKLNTSSKKGQTKVPANDNIVNTSQNNNKIVNQTHIPLQKVIKITKRGNEIEVLYQDLRDNSFHLVYYFSNQNMNRTIYFWNDSIPMNAYNYLTNNPYNILYRNGFYFPNHRDGTK